MHSVCNDGFVVFMDFRWLSLGDSEILCVLLHLLRCCIFGGSCTTVLFVVLLCSIVSFCVQLCAGL